ncbi:MAG TPA: response regulator [Caulobacteraceae bacterium]|jgi:signal transduction histidine kinase
MTHPLRPAKGEDTAILVVDDTEAIRYAKTRTLTRAGYTVIEAGSGGEALALVETRRPALALLDVKLPDMSGLQVCEIIKRDYPQTLVLQISATYVSTADKIKGLGAGADAYLVQPVEPGELVAAVAALLRLRKANDELEQRVAERTEELATANRQLRDGIEERNRIEASLRQAQKMEAVGHLTGGIAHDFNNLLMAIMGNLDLIKRRLADGRTDVELFADNALVASKRAAALTRRLLAFSRRQPLARQSVDVAGVVEDLRPVLRTTVGSSVDVHFEGEEDLWPAWCDRHQLENALLNLIINARDAMPNGGLVRLTAGNVTLDRREAATFGASGAGDYVRVSVEDQGEGMPPDVLERVFEPFFTTKPVGQGTGLGLSMLYGFVRQSGGAVQIRSVVGEGTEVALLLPRLARPLADPQQTIQDDQPARGHGETVLLVEDESLIAGLITEALADHGYECVEARDAREAMAIADSGRHIDLVVTDIGLPGGIDGLTLAAQLKSRSPGLKVLFASGHADAEAAQAQGAPLLQKPFDMNRLIVEVRHALAN